MDEYTDEELATMAKEAWDEAFSKMPPVPYFEACLDAIESAAEVENGPRRARDRLSGQRATGNDGAEGLKERVVFPERSPQRCSG